MKNVKIKLFIISHGGGEEVINDWIEENNIDVIDIKFQSIYTEPHIKDRVLVIYKKEK